MVRAPLPHLCALLAGAAAALAVGCGNRSHLIPASDASSLKDQLAAIQQAVAAGDCTAARDALDHASTAAHGLPRSVDRRLRQRIHLGIAQLRQDVPVDCQQAQTATVDTTTTTVPTVTVPTETTTTETTATETTTTEVPTTPTTTPTTPTTVPTTPAPAPAAAGGTSTDTGGASATGATP